VAVVAVEAGRPEATLKPDQAQIARSCIFCILL
jgi:hypothetical protein